ncbi:MAG: NAD-dependent DNA ligase LigA [Chloroflexi bacterium]|nr:NAD-dependent DNA ligase LigA [Chloroflexota bacterium]
MAKENADRAERLRRTLANYAYRYYVLNDPQISDEAYDSLFRELEQLEEAYPDLVTVDSPTQRAGAPPAEGFEKVEHPLPMLSLGNATTPEELYAWRERMLRLLPEGTALNYVVEPKIDGLTVVLHYVDGLFVLGATRGDGLFGEDITANLRTIRTLPLRIPLQERGPAAPARLIVRGEAYINKAEFVRFQRQQEELTSKRYVNPRNTAAGALRNLDPAVTAARPLDLWAYRIVLFEGEGAPEGQSHALAYLADMGFPVAVDQTKLFSDFDEVVSYCEQWADHKDGLSYEVDGLVIKVNNFGLQERLGYAGKDPRWAVAYKYPSAEATTKLLDITVEVGRTGVLTPRAVLEPIHIGGVTVSSASLHNADHIADNDFRIGDTVVIKRAGEVIPQVLRPVLELRTGDETPWSMPERCPVCDTAVVRYPGEVAYYCENAACPAQLVRRVEFFVSRAAMDIAGFGSKQAELFVKEGYIEDIADIYDLPKHRDRLLAQEGYGEKKVDNLFAALQSSKQQPASRVLTGLGIHFVGGIVAELLLEHYHSFSSLAGANVNELAAIDGIGPRIAESVSVWFAQEANQRTVARLAQAGLQLSLVPKVSEGVQPLQAKVFVITGTLPAWSREQAAAVIKEHGGKVTGSVSSKTDYLLAGERAGAKLAKAEKLGVPVLTEQALRELLGLSAALDSLG